MPRGKARPKVIKEAKVAKNRSVFVKVYLDNGEAEMAFPDWDKEGFHLRHVKNLSVNELGRLHECLQELWGEGHLDD